MGQSVFDVLQAAVIEAVEAGRKTRPMKREGGDGSSDDDPPTGVSDDDDDAAEAEETAHQDKLILDATVAPHAICFPTDLSLLNEAREFSEQVIDKLYAATELKSKPRTCRRKARQAYPGIVKRKRPGASLLRCAVRQQLQYLRRNLGHIEGLLAHFPIGTHLPLPGWLLRRYRVIQQVHNQQWEMYRNKTRRCDDRIVSASANPTCARSIAASSTTRRNSAPGSVRV